MLGRITMVSVLGCPGFESAVIRWLGGLDVGPGKTVRLHVAPCHTSGLSPRSMIPSVMAPGQSVDLTPGGRVGERGSWKLEA